MHAPAPQTNIVRAVVLKIASALLFAVMGMLVRQLGERFPTGQIVFFRSAFAILPVAVIYAWRHELVAAIRTGRPLAQLGRGVTSLGSMFCNFGALARISLVDQTAISFLAPLITVGLSAVVLKERVRIYRWSAVIVGFIGVLVMLAPYLNLSNSATGATGAIGATLALIAAFFTAGSTIQTRALTRSETTASIVLYFSIVCALGGLLTLPFGWVLPDWLELVALMSVGFCGGLAHILLTESYRLAQASVTAPFDYTSMLWALLLGFFVFGEVPTNLAFLGAAIIAAAGLFVIWRERQLGMARVVRSE